MTTHYAILGVPENASNEEIRQAHSRRLREIRNDTNQQRAEDKKKIINSAFNVLKNPEKRRAYNEKLARSRSNSSNTHSSTTGRNNTSQNRRFQQSSGPPPPNRNLFRTSTGWSLPRPRLQLSRLSLPRWRLPRLEPVAIIFWIVFVACISLVFVELGKPALNLFYIAWVPLKFLFIDLPLSCINPIFEKPDTLFSYIPLAVLTILIGSIHFKWKWIYNITFNLLLILFLYLVYLRYII